MAKKKENASPTVKMTISLLLENDENKKWSDSLKPGMYLVYEDISLESLAAMCRDEDSGCPFASLGCPFNNEEWKKMHEGERCTANPCPYVKPKDWLDAFDIYYREKKRYENEYWENA